MTKKNKILKQQKTAIRNYVKKGYSANKIQKKLQNQGLGIQRKKLLAEVRKIKGTKSKTNSQKYTPKKYRRITPRARKPIFFGKHIAIYRYARTRTHPKAYSARFEIYGTGKYLAKATALILKGIVPRPEYPFVECSARDFLNDPYLFGEEGMWVGRPDITS